MPPVRWKLFIAVALVCLTTKQIVQADALHETIPMSSDGWKPILGTSQREVPEEITLYKNPTQTDENSKPVKAQPVSLQTPPPTSATKPYQTISTYQAVVSSPPSVNINGFGTGHVPQVKIAPHAKSHPPILLLPNHPNYVHGPHIPLTAPGHMNKPRRRPVKSKPNGKKRVRPVRGPMIAHSMKNEVYVPAPSAAIGSFAFYNQGLGNIKSQGNKHFQSQFTSPFGLSALQGLPGTNDVIIQQVPVQTFLIQHRLPNQNVQNDKPFINQNDEYTRNLVPPPYKFYQPDKDRQNSFKQKDQPLIPSENTVGINNPQLIIGKPKDTTRHRTVLPDNIIVQLPPPFEHQSQFGVSYNQQQKPKDHEVEVQVTKEKLNVFHNNVPPNYSPIQQQYQQQYNFQTISKPIEEQKVYTFDSFPLLKNNQKQTFRKPSTENYAVFEEPKREIFKKPVSETPNFPTYEVTEGKQWQQGFQPFLSTRPSVPPQESLPPQPPPRVQSPQMEFVFLPTPYTPEGSVPTSPTQSEISSIYAELNQRHQAPHEYSTLNPNYFSIKEVSTHFPIVGRPELPSVFTVPGTGQNSEFSNEITTTKEENHEPLQIYQPIEEPEPTIPPTMPLPPRESQGQRHRQPQRRRRPPQRTRTTTSTTTEEPAPPATESYEVHKIQSSEENYSSETQRPHRRRRPTRVRTTEATPETTKAEEVTRVSSRQRYRNRYELSRIRPTASAESIEEMPSNHKMTESGSISVGITGSDTVNRFRHHYTTEELPVNYENEVAKTETKPEIVEGVAVTTNYPKLTSFGKHYQPTGSEEETTNVRTTEKQTETPTESTSEEQPTHSRRRLRYTSTTTTMSPTTTVTTEQQSVSSILTPENEIDYDYSTQINNFEPSKETITIQEIYTKASEATLATTTPPTTTTTTETSTTKSNRARGRPVKYDNKNRPRFSVKEYRQRLSQYSSSSTETPKTTTESSGRLRFPNRSRRPIQLLQEEEPTTERVKFTPKDPRHGQSLYSATESATTEKKINSRVRQYSRFRSTTEPSTTTLKISIKPNIFSSLRRPPMASLRQRIMNKYNRTIAEKTTEKPTNEIENETENSINVETTIYNIPLDSSTESDVKKIVDEEETTSSEETTNYETAHEEMGNAEIMKNESYLLSQRVADLTLAAQKEYDTPGLFKSVSPNTSRIVPNYFTISTDDPILPIEAFFPNLKDKTSRSDS